VVALPDALTPIAWLIGEWEGQGRGEYPTISDFTYREHATFAHPRPDKPFLAYTQRTWLVPGDAPSHAEVGYLRATPEGRVELVIAQPSGVVEVHDGTATADRIELRSVTVSHTPTAKSVTEVRRVLERRDNHLWYRLDMAAVGQPRSHHCEATLHRVA
jgi:hypothetical protein